MADEWLKSVAAMGAILTRRALARAGRPP
eukprot:SAG11_NODE_21296_length_428_cov_0.556231_1_plen_28_part_10